MSIAQIRLQAGDRIVLKKEKDAEREWGEGGIGGWEEKQQKKSGQGRQIAGPAGVYLMALKGAGTVRRQCAKFVLIARLVVVVVVVVVGYLGYC